MARITKAQRAALAAAEAGQGQQASDAAAAQQAQAPWPFPKGATKSIEEIDAEQQKADGDSEKQSEEISDEELARQQSEAESQLDKAIEESIAAADAAAPQKGAKKLHIPKSSILLPTKKAWAIYDAMRKHAEENSLPYPSRGECIAKAIQAGIASGTSATQYQYWKKHYGY